jgi:very-short-patch-repair endonuclease
MKVDILNATKKIAIEVNGPQHNSFNKFFHNNSRMSYLNSIKRDYQKREWLEKNNFKIIELEEQDIKKLSPEFIENTFGISIL